MSKPVTAWSYSRWSDYDTCPAKFDFKHVQRLPEPENIYMARGSEVHDVIAAYLRGDLPADDPIPGWTYFASLFRQLRSLDPIVEQEWGFNRQWGDSGWFGKDTWFRSKLDSLVVYDDNSADVIDLKTGKPSPKHAQQAELYAISVKKRHPHVTQIIVRFWYVDLEQAGKESVFRFSSDMIPDLVKRWTQRAEKMLNDQRRVPRPGQHCNWCHYRKSNGGPCKYGA